MIWSIYLPSERTCYACDTGYFNSLVIVFQQSLTFWRRNVSAGRATKKTCLAMVTMERRPCVSASEKYFFAYFFIYFIVHSFSSFNYLTGNGTDAFYQRKHSELADYNSTNQNPRRAGLMRNFNDFANDIQHDSLPSMMFITPNIVDDAHDTGIPFGSQWLDYFLFPLLENENFNGPETLVLVIFDENENGPENNRIYAVATGNAIPKHLQGTQDNTYLNHYTILSTTQLNWGLNCLGRQDTNR